jgi:hypothetical protein
MEQSLWAFLTYDYAEAKDLAKAFLTLVSAVLVGTITFSEKIVNFQTASLLQRLLVIGSWGFFVFAIITCGIAIVLDYNSVLAATGVCWHRACEYALPFGISLTMERAPHDLLLWGNRCMILSGCFFALGLLSLVISAVVAASPTNKSPLDIT